jgi:uncharacterized protein
MNAARAFIVALALCWVSAAFSIAVLADVAVPPFTAEVVDQTATLSSSDIAALTQKLLDLQRRKGSQIAVLIVPTTQPETIEQYSIRVADAWKVGRKKIDDGALLVIAKNDRHLRIEVGYGLEGALTDITTKRIIDEDITPKFRSGDFAGGVTAGINRIIRLIDGEPLPAPEPPHWQNSGLLSGIDPFNPFILFALFIVGATLRTALGRLIGSFATGGIVGLGAWLIAGSIAASIIAGTVAFVFMFFAGSTVSANPSVGRGRYGGGAWSGGSSSGSDWSSSSSSDSGGFSGGGGGSFGGGGASGSW